MTIPKRILLFRIIHRDNLEHILQVQMICCPNHTRKVKIYRTIGEKELITLRNFKKIPIEPYGTIADYVSFYLGPRPVMLYCIMKGYDVQAVPQEEIIYLVSSFEKIQQFGYQYVYTDGHGYDRLTYWFNDPDGFKELDWGMIYARNWSTVEKDTDRRRRKQAEFLVHSELDLKSIEKFVVYNKNALNYVDNLLAKYPKIDYILTEINRDYYY